MVHNGRVESGVVSGRVEPGRVENGVVSGRVETGRVESRVMSGRVETERVESRVVSGRVGWHSKRVETGRETQQKGGDWKGGTAKGLKLEGW